MKLCPCWNGDYSKCLFPGTPVKFEVARNFKDEPDRSESIELCNFKHYWGPTSINFCNITRKQYNEMLRNKTFCTKGE